MSSRAIVNYLLISLALSIASAFLQVRTDPSLSNFVYGVVGGLFFFIVGIPFLLCMLFGYFLRPRTVFRVGTYSRNGRPPVTYVGHSIYFGPR
jgi:hypothetical protein